MISRRRYIAAGIAILSAFACAYSASLSYDNSMAATDYYKFVEVNEMAFNLDAIAKYLIVVAAYLMSYRAIWFARSAARVYLVAATFPLLNELAGLNLQKYNLDHTIFWCAILASIWYSFHTRKNG